MRVARYLDIGRPIMMFIRDCASAKVTFHIAKLMQRTRSCPSCPSYGPLPLLVTRSEWAAIFQKLRAVWERGLSTNPTHTALRRLANEEALEPTALASKSAAGRVEKRVEKGG